MKQFGEPEMSSVITARLNHICKETSHLTIQILCKLRTIVFTTYKPIYYHIYVS